MNQLVGKGPGQESVLVTNPTQGPAALPRLSAISHVPFGPEHVNSLCHMVQCCPVTYRKKPTCLSTAWKTPTDMAPSSRPISCLIITPPPAPLSRNSGLLAGALSLWVTSGCWPLWMLSPKAGSLLGPLLSLPVLTYLFCPLTLTCRLTFSRTL